jgi:hypothetical protein
VKRSLVTPLAVLVLGCAVPAALAAEGAPASAHTPVVLPSGLPALEQKMEELEITSMRFSARASITVPRSERKLLGFLKLLGGESGISGEETISPAAGNITLGLFGHPFKLRVVGSTTYYFARASRHHRGIWVKLGPGGILEMFIVNGKHIKVPKATPPKEPTLAEPSFAGLRKALAGAEEVRELGTGTLYGQPVTNFLAVLEPEQLKLENPASTSRLAPHPPQPPTVTLETSIAQDGLPVRTVVAEQSEGTVISVTLNIPAINFPLVIEAPPASETITVAQLRRIERRDRRHHHPKRKQ